MQPTQRTYRVLLLSLFALVAVQSAAAQEFEWIRQVGTTGTDLGFAVTSSASRIYVAGYTNSAFPGQANAGGLDAFVCKYDTAGNHSWCRQLGTTALDEALGVVSDASGIYVTGITAGTFPGQTDAGLGVDAFLCKYDSNGIQLWCKQFGTLLGVLPYGLSSDPSGIYIAGYAYSAFPGQPYVGGYSDAFLCKYDTEGNQCWCRQFGTTDADYGYAVASGNAGIYVAGYTAGALPGQTNLGGFDAFVCKYDTDGNQSWCRQLGTTSSDSFQGATSDNSGIYVGGFTEGALPGQTNAGSYDAVVCKYDPDGSLLWCHQFGTATADVAYGMGVGAEGVYITGYSYGVFPDQTSAGSSDVFLAKLEPPNQAPVADAGPDLRVILGEYVQFDSSGSYDPDGTICEYLWAFGDDGTAIGTTALHVYTSPGVFSLTLTVEDEWGATGTDMAVITVVSPANAIADIATIVQSFNLQQGISNALDVKLENVMQALQAANAGQRNDAINKLQAFISAVEAQRGKEITVTQADALIASASRILGVLLL